MKQNDHSPQKANQQLESEGKSFLKPPSFALSAAPAEAPEDGGAAQFKKNDALGGGADAPEENATQFKKGDGADAHEENTAQFQKGNGAAGAAAGSGDLPSELRSQMESSLGANFGDVKINANSNKASEMGALAYAQGNEVHFAPGQFNPATQAGQELIGHELAHVVQQREGRVQATGQEGGMAVNTDHRLEAEADQLGAKAAAQMKSADSGQQAEVGSFGGGSIMQKAEDPTKPQFEAYKGASVNQPGRVSAPAAQYQTAKSTGVNVRSKPDHTLPAIGKLYYNDAVQVIAEDNCGGYYFVVGGGVTGWINKSYVAMGMPDFMADLHHITESNLTTILKQHYVDSGKWSLGTGNDYTTLAAAVLAANAGRAGVSVDWKKAQAWKDNNKARAFVDPWMADNFAIYDASKVVKGTNIWLPPAGYIKLLQESGVVGARPEALNEAVAIGKSLTGFSIGVQAGIYGDLWGMLTGLWDMGKGIVDAIKGILDGSLFSSIKDIYDKVKDMSKETALEMAMSVINMGKSAIGDFMASWNSGDEYKKWFFRGKIVGTIVTEIVLAIVTVGESVAVQLVSKLGKYFPKLAGVATKILKVADKLTPGGGKKKPQGNGAEVPNRDKTPDGEGDNDKDALDWKIRLGIATALTEQHDAIDTPVDVLLGILGGVAKTSEAVSGYRKEALPEPGHYRIVQFTKKPETVDRDYSGKDENGPFAGQNRVFGPDRERVPYGFKSFEDFQAFVSRLRRSLPEGTRISFQGSSASGRSFMSGKPFDVGRISDFDIALSSDDLYLRALELDLKSFGLKEKGGGRIGPLNDEIIEALGLKEARSELSKTAGRDVNFMLYENPEVMYSRGDLIEIF